ncbi:MAG: glutathione S-transferase N-terminal domain-containing protein, partial [Allosphingosinicella sp.]
MSQPVLYDYHRSSTCYRVRIALNLKSVEYRAVAVNLLEGEQRAADFRARNPQGLVPLLEVEGLRLTQSLAILDWLDETRPEPPLLPAGAADRA